MPVTITPLHQLEPNELNQLVILHCEVMHTLLAKLGKSIVQRYYEIAQKDNSVIGLCAVTETGEINAWAMGSVDPTALNSKLRDNPGWFAVQLLIILVTRPLAFWELVLAQMAPSEINRIQPGQIELTYIGVAANVQKQGIGKLILNSFCLAAIEKGYTSIILSVETDNLSAIRLYKSYGFQIIRTFQEGRFQRYRMEYSIKYSE